MWCITPRVGLEPTSQNPQSIENKALTENQNSVFTTSLDKLVQKYPDLEQIINAWPELPEQIKSTIVSLVKKERE
ncbi:MAG: hypothetical protein JW787_02870 [Sedimentisphaerales bacterium]|nr:hypothetical protein [Sedimentisphaerales bacterium]